HRGILGARRERRAERLHERRVERVLLARAVQREHGDGAVAIDQEDVVGGHAPSIASRGPETKGVSGYIGSERLVSGEVSGATELGGRGVSSAAIARIVSGGIDACSDPDCASGIAGSR